MRPVLLLPSLLTACTLGEYPDDLTEVYNRLDYLEAEMGILEAENAVQAETIAAQDQCGAGSLHRRIITAQDYYAVGSLRRKINCVETCGA